MNHIGELLNLMEKSIEKAASKIREKREKMHPSVKQLSQEIR